MQFTVRGTMETREMLDAVSNAAAQLERDVMYQVLSDSRDVTTPITPMQTKDLIARLRETGMTNQVRRAAVVVGNEASYGMMRLLGARAEPLGVEIGVFWTLEEALAFLSLPSEE